MATDIDNLEQLDQRIELLLGRLDGLQREKEQLLEQVRQANAQIQHLETELRKQENVHSEIRSRIDKLLSRFDHLDLS